MESDNTIRKIMDRMLENIEIIKNGDIIETFDTVYPNDKSSNIIIEGVSITIPLACTKEWKKVFLKQKSPLCSVYKELKRGDILKVKNISSTKITVENLSLKEEYRKDFVITKEDIVKKNFSVVKRKSAELNKILEELS